MAQKSGTPAKVHKTQAGARDNESVAASGILQSTIAGQQKAPALEQPGARASFTDTLITRGVSVRAGSPKLTPGTTVRNAWLGRFYRVDACLRVEAWQSHNQAATQARGLA